MFYLRVIRPLLHFFIILLVFLLVYKLRTYTDLIPFVHLKIPPIDFNETMIFAFISAVLFVLIWFLKWLYKLYGPIHGYYHKFLKVFLLWFVFITFLAFFWYWYIFKNGISRLIIFWWVFFSFFVLLICDFVINYLNSNFEEKNPYKIWVFKTPYFSQLAEKFKWYKIYKLFEIDKLDEIPNYDVIFLIWSVDSNFLEDVMDKARLYQIPVYHIPDVNFMEDILYQPERIWPIISWKYKPSPLEWWWKIFKRIFDIIFSLVFILLFWWLYILIALRIYFHDRRPIFYVSERIGQWWKKIKIYKFRTMVRNADNLKKQLMDKNERDDVLFKMENDPRIQPWGKFLRKTSLDEIPQFFNVLKWDMSIAGPRPHLEEEVKKYKKWQKRLLAAKPGITGYAQVFGRDLPFEEEAKLDLYRFQNWSVWMDIIVILWVFRTLLKGK